MNLALLGLTLADALADEYALVNWLIAEAASAHESQKAHAQAAGKPEPSECTRLLERLQQTRIKLLGIPLGPPKPQRAPAQPPEPQPQEPEGLAAVPCPPQAQPVVTPPGVGTSPGEPTRPQPPLAQALGAAGHTPAPLRLNRAQRRAQARQDRKAAKHLPKPG
jgi:hypothetical protein